MNATKYILQAILIVLFFPFACQAGTVEVHGKTLKFNGYVDSSSADQIAEFLKGGGETIIVKEALI